jgi:hypothetical protein
MEWSDSSLTYGNMAPFTEDWGKPQRTSVRIADSRAEIWNMDLRIRRSIAGERRPYPHTLLTFNIILPM